MSTVTVGQFINGRVGEIDLIRAGWRFMQRTMTLAEINRFQRFIEQPGFCVKKFEEDFLLKKINPFAQNQEHRHIKFSHLDCNCGRFKDVCDMAEVKKRVNIFMEKWEDVFDFLCDGGDLSDKVREVYDLHDEAIEQIRNIIKKCAETKEVAVNTHQAETKDAAVEMEPTTPRKENAVAEQCCWNVAHISAKPTHPKPAAEPPVVALVEVKETPSTSSTKVDASTSPIKTMESRKAVVLPDKAKEVPMTSQSDSKEIPNANQDKNVPVAKLVNLVDAPKVEMTKTEEPSGTSAAKIEIAVAPTPATQTSSPAVVNVQDNAPVSEDVPKVESPILTKQVPVEKPVAATNSSSDSTTIVKPVATNNDASPHPAVLQQQDPISVACTDDTASLPSPLTQDGISPAITDTGRTAGTPDSGMISDVSEFKNAELDHKDEEKPFDPATVTGRNGRRLRKKLEAERLAQEKAMVEEESEEVVEESQRKESLESEQAGSDALTGKQKKRIKDKLRKEKKEQERLDALKKAEEDKKEQERLNALKKEEEAKKEQERLETLKREEEAKKEQERLDALRKMEEENEAKSAEPVIPTEPAVQKVPVEEVLKEVRKNTDAMLQQLTLGSPNQNGQSTSGTAQKKLNESLEEPALGAAGRLGDETMEDMPDLAEEPNLEMYSVITDDSVEDDESVQDISEDSPPKVAEQKGPEEPKKLSKSQKKRAQKKANKGVYVVNDNGSHSVELLPGEYKIVKLDQSRRLKERATDDAPANEVNIDEKIEEKSQKTPNSQKKKKLQNYLVAGHLSKDILDNGKWLAYVIDDKKPGGSPRIGEVNTEEVAKTIQHLDDQISGIEHQSPVDRYMDDFDYDTIMTNGEAEQFVQEILPELDADYVRGVFQKLDDDDAKARAQQQEREEALKRGESSSAGAESSSSGSGAGESLCPLSMLKEYLPKASSAVDDLEAYITCEPSDIVFRSEFARRTAPLFIGNNQFKEFCIKYSKSKYNPASIHTLIKKYIDARIVHHYQRFKKLADYDARRISAQWSTFTEKSRYVLMVMLFINIQTNSVGWADIEAVMFDGC